MPCRTRRDERGRGWKSRFPELINISIALQVYHLCNRHGGGMAFECPQGTRFQQRTMVCDHEHLVECHQSAKYFHSNLRIGQANLNFIDDKKRSSSKLDQK